MSRIWEDFKPALSDEIIKIVKSFEFETATPVQAAAIPLLLSHKDVVVEAVTGSGKTLAFLLPLLQILENTPIVLKDHRRIGALVISPTRELAVQIHETLTGLLRTSHLKPLLLIGGVTATLEEDYEKYRREGGNVIIGTPGRLEEFFKRYNDELASALKDAFELLVLDEADRLLDLGFETSIRNILQKLPKQRRTGLFSATMTEAIGDLIRTGLRNPVRVTVKVDNSENNGEDSRVPTTLSIHYKLVDSYEEKLVMFLNLIRSSNGLQGKKVIVYFATCACVDYYSKVFEDLFENEIWALHGKMPHNKRTSVYRGFLDSTGGSILFCTDLAARGLDFPDIDWVIQFDPPQDPKSFLHRCGRTARSGRSGDALVFLQRHEDAYIEMLSGRGIPMTEFEPISDNSSIDDQIIDKLKQKSLDSREIYESSIKAFVSFIRFYQEHQAKFIFRLKELNIPSLARCFGLLRLPSMPELKNYFIPSQLEGFVLTPHDADAIAYTDKTRERQRQAGLEKKRSEKASNSKVRENNDKKRQNKVAWSEQKARKEARQTRKEKKQRKRDYLHKVKQTKLSNDTPREDDNNDNGNDEDDFAEMDEEYKELKRERKMKK